MNLGWINNFITGNDEIGYTAWDETQSRELGTFKTEIRAAITVLEYAEVMDYG